MHHRSHDWGSASAGGSTSGGGVCIQGGRSPSDTIGYGQQAGGTHSTGIHSCWPFIFIKQTNW